MAGLSDLGVGLGLRRDMFEDFDELAISRVSFMEIAPENWINVGGAYAAKLRQFTHQFPFICHGLSLSIGGPEPIDTAFVHSIKSFLDEHQVRCYSEHLSYCSDGGHLYDLMPIPFTEEAVGYVAARVRQVQDILEQRIALENVSYYAAPGQEMSESEFLQAVISEADCELLFDVNNVYVNSINHGYDARAFIDAMPTERMTYFHIAGHFDEAEDLLIDTHGEDVKEDVWSLLRYTYHRHGIFPTLLERDFNIPPMSVLLQEVDRIGAIQQEAKASQARDMLAPSCT